MATVGPSAGQYAQVSYTDTGLTAGTTYQYEVTALNGPYSSSTPAPVSATTPTATPTPTPTVRFNADGSLDRSFGYNGMSHGDANGGYQGGGVGASAIAVDPTDGSVIVVGGVEASQYVPPSIGGTRLLSNGNAADSFAYAQNPNGAAGYDVLVQSDRKIVVVGYDGTGSSAQRLNPDGTLDPSWVGPGEIMIPPDGTSQIDGIAQLADGSYVAVGMELPFTGSTRTAYGLIAHLNTDGTMVNKADGSSGIVTYQVPDTNTVGPYNTTYDAVVVAPDGSIYAGGATHGWLLISEYRLT